MNFFEHQQAAKSRTRWLVLLFALAVIVIIALVDLVLLIAFGEYPESVADGGYFSANAGGLVAGAVATALLILLASLFRFITLSGGGGKVARELGGTLVDALPRGDHDVGRDMIGHVLEVVRDLDELHQVVRLLGGQPLEDLHQLAGQVIEALLVDIAYHRHHQPFRRIHRDADIVVALEHQVLAALVQRDEHPERRRDVVHTHRLQLGHGLGQP